MKKRNRLITLVITFALLLSVAACGNASKETASEDGKTVVKIGYLPITHALAVFEEKERLERENSDITIELVKFSAWSDLTDALNSGRIDGASVLIELAMSAATQGIDLKAVALGHKDGNVVVVANDIRSVADLKGKTFAIPHTQSSHNILLNDFLKENGLSIEDIEVVQLAPSEMTSSLASGSISGYCVAEPFGAQAVSQGVGQVLYYSEELWENSLCCGLVFNGSFIDNNKEVFDNIVEKYYEAGNSLNGENGLELAKEYLGQDEETLKTSLEWIHYDDLVITEEDYQILADKVKEYGINDNPPEYEEFVYQAE